MNGHRQAFVGKLKGLLKPAGRDGEPAPAVVHLACFGKHPGWDDHMEHLGIETDHLTHLWEQLYQKGIRLNLDRGTWATKLRDEDRLGGFDHEFLWLAGDTADLGQMWASRDRKGRADYPMIACASGERTGIEWLRCHAPDTLTTLRAACERTSQSEDVVREAAAARERVRSALQDHPPTGGAPSQDGLARLARVEPLKSDQEQLIRFVYHVERECLAPGTSTGTNPDDVFSAHFLRVPGLGPDLPYSLQLWAEATRQLVGDSPLFLSASRGADWVDISVGFPGVEEIFALLAKPAAIAPVTLIPYDIDDEHRARILALAGVA